jgi:hypothetical protein
MRIPSRFADTEHNQVEVEAGVKQVAENQFIPNPNLEE